MAVLTRYPNVWNNLFGNRFINLGISGDRVENVLWRAIDIPFLPSLKDVVILCRTNNINKDPLYDITQGLIAIGSVFKNQSSNPNIFICGLLPRDESFSISRLIVNDVNDLLKSKCLFKTFHFINQNNGWTLNNGTLVFWLFYSDALHLVEKGNLKLGKSILKAIDSNSNANPCKSAVCFNLNECGSPPLPAPANRSKPLHFPEKCVGPVRKTVRRFFKSFIQGYEPFRLTVLPACSVPVSVSHSSLHQLLVTSAPCVSLVAITTATFPSRIPNICYANAPIRFFSSKLKTISSLEFSLSSHQKCAPTSATRSPYSRSPACVRSPPVTTLSVSSQKNSGRATSVPPSFLPSSIVVSSVNSLNSSDVARTKSLSFKATKSLVPKSLPLFKTSICINSSVSGTVSDGAVSDSLNTSQSCVALVQHPISNSKRVEDLDSFNSGDIYLSSLSKFSSFCPYWYYFWCYVIHPNYY